jgi:hypothetical protein
VSRPYWRYQDPHESSFLALVSADLLMVPGDFKFTRTAVVRERNRAVAALDEATETIDELTVRLWGKETRS